MLSNKRKLVLAALGLSTLMLSACGGQSYQSEPSSNVTGGGSSSGSTPTGVTTPTGGGTTVVPGYSMNFSLVGYGNTGSAQQTTGDIGTDRTLKVQITAGPPGTVSIPGGVYSNYQAQYGCVGYTVTLLAKTSTGSYVVSKSVNTDALSTGTNNWLCPSAAQSQTIDFSDRITNGHGAFAVQISNARYDYYCQMLYMGWISGNAASYCLLHTVYQTHTTTGSALVLVDGS